MTTVRDKPDRRRHPNQDAALDAHRAGTQFKPLDPSSETTVLQLRVPRSLIARVDAAATVAGKTRSAWVRSAVLSALDEN